MTSTTTRISLGAILLSFVLLAAGFSAVVPIFENSDEAEHFIYIHTLLQTGELPVIQSREAMAAQEDPVQRWNNQSHHAPLYYLLSSALVSWSQREDLRDYLIPNELIFLRDTTENNANKWLHRYDEPGGDTQAAVFVLRAANVAIGCGTLLLIFACAWQISDNRLLALSATAFAAFLPTFIVVNSSVTNDALLLFFYTAGVLWSLVTWRNETLTLSRAVLLGLIVSGTALTKLTGLSLFGVVFVVLVLGAWRKKWTWQQAIVTFAVGLLMTALLAGWWYLRNWQIYGDPLAVSATQTIWGREGAVLWGEELLRIGKTFWMMVGYLHSP
ncbi:MAG: phospholipid carrier-dependent glycosyltransferase, partial [Anaerolineae bacterium]|nr:phospholipid carrier-dependent glycosyltransferase [Anaerolineae bacterium]